MGTAAGTAAPPRRTVGPIQWLRENLFSSLANTVLTLLALWMIWQLAITLFSWGVLHATWDGRDGGDCREGGACWPFASAWFGQFLYGRYPDAERWRVNLTYALAAAGLVPLMIPRVPGKLWSALYLLVVFPVLGVILLSGGVLGLAQITTDLWGGLLVTLVIASTGIAAAFPIGIVLALGRRSPMPIVRWVSIGFIEVIRGGLQAIPRGQFEAADALGLSYPHKMGLIVLPQALKLVIPGIVGSFIALFKDTSLVLIIGIFDLLGMAQAASSAPAWLSPSTPMTAYAVAGMIFWIFCFGMSRYSQMLERRLAAGGQRVAAKAME